VTQPHDDDRLAERLRASDPAASLPPADGAWVDRLLEDTMGNDLLTESRETGTHNRSPLTWLVAAAAAVIIVGAGVFAVVHGMNTNEPSTPPQAGPAPAVTELHAPGAAAASGRCASPSAAMLAGNPVAFDGTVESISDGLVTLRATRWYAGTPTDRVQVEAPSADLQKLLIAVHFEDGGRYLVTANQDDQLMVCGLSGQYTPHLARLYEKAFAG
jgi:hypothetical protein